ncbi:MAG: C25 family cysteine peptidase, partial [Anaerolineae bacterium]
WVDHDIYWLTAGVTGTLMTERSGNPSGVAEEGALWTTEVAESNIGEDNYRSWYPSGRDGDHWYWSKLWRNYSLGIGDYDQTFDVQLLEPESAGTAALTLYLQGEVGSPDLFPDHQVVVHLNGNGPLSETLAWDSDAYFSESLVAPLETLGPGTNQVRLVIPDGRGTSGIDRLWLDAIEVSYPVSGLGGAAAMVEAQPGVKRYTVTTGYGGAEPRIYDVSQISAARVLSDAATSGDSVTFADNDEGEASYFIFSESHITTPGWIRPIQPLEESLLGAEYLIISHSDFITSVAPLAHHRAVSDGLDVRTVSVEAIYDTFGDGRMDPAAIRRCISDTYHSSFPPLLDYVLLVGDGTYDPLDNLDSPYHRPTFIPPYLAYGDPYQGEVTADNRYVTLDGPDDRLPEVSLGRLPVNSPAEAAAVVNKVLMYELEPPLWPWNETLYFFADASEEDNAFHEESDDLYDRAATLDGLSPERRYYCKQDCSQPHLIEGRTEMRRATLDALNRGSLLATWVGHAFWHQWGTDRVFHLEDVSSLHNGGALPVYLQMTCLTSYFSLPDTDALDEALLRLEGGGAVATWGSTSFGLTASHVKMHHGFVGAALGDDPQPLGPSADAGELEAPSSYWDSFVLLGDPAMKLNLEVVPWSHQVALPLVMRGSY